MGHTSCGGTEWNYQRRAHSGHLIPYRLIDGHWGGSPRDFSKAGTQWPLNTFSADCRPFGGGNRTDFLKAGAQRPLDTFSADGWPFGGETNGLIEGGHTAAT